MRLCIGMSENLLKTLLGATLVQLISLSCNITPYPYIPEIPSHLHDEPVIREFPRGPVPVRRMQFGRYFVYYGDFHNHSNLSDGTGTPRQAYDYARNEGGFDFFSLADHDYLLTDDKWKLMKATADSCNEDSAFVALWGFEWSSWTYDHCAIIGSEEMCSSVDSATDTFTELCEWLSGRTAFAFFNHPGRLGSNVEFNRFSDTPVEQFVGMELYNKWDGFSRYYYNDGIYPDDNNKGFFDEALSRGWRIGAAGGGDNHYGTWGTMTDYRIGILAPACTRAEITGALSARRFFSTLDKNIALNFTAGTHEMGSVLRGNDFRFIISALDGNGEQFTEVLLYDGNHDIVAAWHPNTSMVSITYGISVPSNNYFYVKVTQSDGDEAISSPLWIIAEE